MSDNMCKGKIVLLFWEKTILLWGGISVNQANGLLLERVWGVIKFDKVGKGLCIFLNRREGSVFSLNPRGVVSNFS